MSNLKKLFCVLSITTAVLHVSMAASEKCPCLTLQESPLTSSSFRSEDGTCLIYEADGESYCLPLDYGVDECKAHDQGLEPYCNSVGFPGPPDWCGQSWCYVDPNNCDEVHYESSFFPGINLRYSHSTCGGGNTFISWMGDGVSRSFSDLTTLIERYVVGVKLSLESRVDSIRQFSSNTDNVQKECTPNNSCDCSECQHHSCWGLDIDFQDSNIALHTERELINEMSDVNFMKCLTNDISVAYSRISERENNNEDRVGYQYYGDQGTGALIQAPETKFCSESYDARFRPWYAAAASGPKDVVVVVDTSGSMQGLKMQMAISAIQAVARTLTWVDYVTVISFHSQVSKVYSSRLVAATEEVVDDIIQWAETLQADGGTNFDDPLDQAYAILEASKDSNDRETCAQAILFMTDGQAGFDVGAFENLAQTKSNVVVFSYALGADAAVEPLQHMACATGGVFYPITDASNLPKLMSEYYRYFITLQDTCKLSWIKYTDAMTGSPLVAGCSPIFNYGDNTNESPELVGVTCQDLNTIVSLKQLQTCTNRGLAQFVDQIRQESATCPLGTTAGSNGKITDECTLQRIRAEVSAESVCPSNVTPLCDLPLQATQSSCDRLDPNRFQKIELSGCQTDVQESCAPEYTSRNGPSAAWTSRGRSLKGGMIAVIVAVVIVVVLVLLVSLKIRRTKKLVTFGKEECPKSEDVQNESIPEAHDNVPIAVEVVGLEPVPVPEK